MKAATEKMTNATIILNISIHAAREGGDPVRAAGKKNRGISIHAAREGGDRRTAADYTSNRYFNPRRP